MEKKEMLHTLLIEINGKIEGAELAVKYKDKYYVINGGYNPDYRNLGKLLIIEHIKKAIELKAKEIDFLIGDSGWKELWNLDTQECYTIKKINID
jgi:CelD/BcsL family acetyltransferase involved in cellulose biosynthesis